jgi:hypothetical protein
MGMLIIVDARMPIDLNSMRKVVSWYTSFGRAIRISCMSSKLNEHIG